MMGQVRWPAAAAALIVVLSGCVDGGVAPSPGPTPSTGQPEQFDLCVVGGMAASVRDSPVQSFGSLVDQAVGRYGVARQHLRDIRDSSTSHYVEGIFASHGWCEVLFAVGSESWPEAEEFAAVNPGVHVVLTGQDAEVSSTASNVTSLVIDYRGAYQLAGRWIRPLSGREVAEDGGGEVGAVLVHDSGSAEQRQIVEALQAGMATEVDPDAPTAIVLDVSGMNDRTAVADALEAVLVSESQWVVPIDERTAPWVVDAVVAADGRAALYGAGIDLWAHYPQAHERIAGSVAADLYSPVATILDAVWLGQEVPDIRLTAGILPGAGVRWTPKE